MPRAKKRAIPCYPHFDARISFRDAEKLAFTPASVATHSFLPLLSYDLSWIPYGKRNSGEAPKSRTIRYAARRDAFIFSHYRSKLEVLYERELEKSDLGSNVLAYRKVPIANTGRNKSNVQFAREAFEKVVSMAPCFAICLDIRSFFDSIDHENVKIAWCRLLGVERLPEDHYAVFKAVTAYAHVNRIDAYVALGIIAPKVDEAGKKSIGYTHHWNDMPTQLCDPATFRKTIRPLVQRHTESFGVPQGVPISDLLSNLSLLEFDKAAKSLIVGMGGEYYRYSDDILILLPDGHDPEALEKTIVIELSKAGPKMQLKQSKCSIHSCSRSLSTGKLIFRQVKPVSGPDGLEYLGYRFDGQKIFIRTSTLSRLHRKITYSIRWHVKLLLAANAQSTVQELMARLNVDLIHGRFGRRPRDVDKGTFFSYAKRSQEDHAPLTSGSLSQVKRLKRFIRWRAEKELTEAHKKNRDA